MVEDIDVEQLIDWMTQEQVAVIDVRSPREYSEGTVPGSWNIPLFGDAERSEIGTIYKQQSIEAAKDRGLEIVSAKLPSFIRELQAIPKRKVFFCWRGGMRSKTAATLYSLLSGKVYRLRGGYRAYRRWIVQTMATYQWKPALIVVNGYTGTGKTKIIRSLHDQGYPVLDLEQLAGHRGSIFGGVGLKAQNQRTFDALLMHECIRLQNSPYVIMEAESRRIGKIVLPDFLMEAKSKSPQLVIRLPIDVRVASIIEDYEPHRFPAECMEAFRHIERKIHTPAATTIRDSLVQGEYAEATRLLLLHYYDPRYEFKLSEHSSESLVLDADSISQAEAKVKDYIIQTVSLSIQQSL